MIVEELQRRWKLADDELESSEAEDLDSEDYGYLRGYAEAMTEAIDILVLNEKG